MLNFLWWFVAGPAVGWLTGKLSRASGNGWLDALVGLVGAVLVGTAFTFAGLDFSNSAIGAAVTGALGAFVVTMLYRKLVAKESMGAGPGRPNSKSYTSYKSRMDK